QIGPRSSPTVVVMMFLRSMTAGRVGYIGLSDLAMRMSNALDTLDRRESYRGHLVNWYDTRHLTPLEPRCVSTVDSGNLAVSLIAYAETLREAAVSSDLEGARWRGLEDCLQLIIEAAGQLPVDASSLARQAADILAPLRLAERRASDWPADLDTLCGSALPSLKAEAARLVEQSGVRALEAAGDLAAWVDRLDHQAQAMRHDV